jgi:hypothetical protein
MLNASFCQKQQAAQDCKERISPFLPGENLANSMKSLGLTTQLTHF